MAKRAQIASLATSRGGGKKTIFATGRTSGAQKYSPEEKEKEKEKEKAGRGRARLRDRKKMKDKIKKESRRD